MSPTSVEKPVPASLGPGMCCIDSPATTGSEFHVSPNTAVEIKGWAFGDTNSAVPTRVSLEVVSEATGETFLIEARRTPRPDVAAHYAAPDLAGCGFLALLRMNHQMFGAYEIRIRQTVEEGVYASGTLLRLRLPMQRYESDARQGLANRFISGNGLEIGALHRSLPVPPNCKVTYVDRLSLDDLLRHYPELRGTRIQPPDLVDNGETLEKVTDSSQSFVIANHFLEHCANPIQTIANFLRVLRPGGILFLAVPNKTYTFDFHRPLTGFETLKRTWETGVRDDRPELYEEWILKVKRSRPETAKYDAAQLMRQNYSIHYNVWDVPAFLEFFFRIRQEAGLPFDLLSMVTSENEMIIVAEKRATS